MPLGYTGKILRVDLSSGTISTEEPDENFYRRYFGGRGVIAYYLLKEVPRGTDPLAPDNLLIFSAGPITGVALPGAGRHSVGAKSPVTGGYGEAEAGGFFGAELKHAGFDAIIFKGRASNPVYLWIYEGQAELRDASHLWGKTTGETQTALRQELNDQRIRVSCIGPAGENLVRFACIINDLRDAAGRCGLGAVMGSKRLKAVAVRGNGRVETADLERIKALARYVRDGVPTRSRGLHDNGTAGGVPYLNASGGLPTCNFQQGWFELADKISGDTMRQTILIGRETCYACPIRCKRVVRTPDPFPTDPQYGGPEYETIAALGSNCGIGDLAAIARANMLCNAYGLDTIATGSVIAFAMECAERGLLGSSQSLSFGDAKAMLDLVEAIAFRRGLGNLLAEGSWRAAQGIGQEALSYAMHVKGQELPMHEPRWKMGMGLGYALSVTGADHMHNIHDNMYTKPGSALEDLRSLGILEPLPTNDLSLRKVRLLVYGTLARTIDNYLQLCMFQPYGNLQKVEIVRAVTGWNVSLWELMKVSERGTTLARLFNVREGLSSQCDDLPDRMFEPFRNGPLAGVALDRQAFLEAKQAYYAIMGWDAHGVPTRGKLAELDISWAEETLSPLAT